MVQETRRIEMQTNMTPEEQDALERLRLSGSLDRECPWEHSCYQRGPSPRQWYVIDCEVVARLALREHSKKCKWSYDEDHDKQDTSCGKAFSFEHGGILDNSFKYCPFCGGIIVSQ